MPAYPTFTATDEPVDLRAFLSGLEPAPPSFLRLLPPIWNSFTAPAHFPPPPALRAWRRQLRHFHDKRVARRIYRRATRRHEVFR